MISLERLLAWLRALAAVYRAGQGRADRPGRGHRGRGPRDQHGPGFSAVAADLAASPPADIAAALKAAAMTLIRTVGGAAGPLYGTFFLRASAACAGLARAGPRRLAGRLPPGRGGRAAAGQGRARGQDHAGRPAARRGRRCRRRWREGLGLPEILRRAERAAQAGMAGDHSPAGAQGPGQLPGRAQHRPPGPRRHLGAPAGPGRGRRLRLSMVGLVLVSHSRELAAALARFAQQAAAGPHPRGLRRRRDPLAASGRGRGGAGHRRPVHRRGDPVRARARRRPGADGPGQRGAGRGDGPGASAGGESGPACGCARRRWWKGRSPPRSRSPWAAAWKQSTGRRPRRWDPRPSTWPVLRGRLPAPPRLLRPRGQRAESPSRKPRQ